MLSFIFSDKSDDEGCSHLAVVSPEATVERQSTWIEAEDTRSGRVLRCEVFVDKIAHIEVLTTSKKFYRSDLELLKVQAFDSEGNLFSSVEGLQFRWSIRAEDAAPGSKATPHVSVLRFVPFRDANVEVSSTVLAMEDKVNQIPLLRLMVEPITKPHN